MMEFEILEKLLRVYFDDKDLYPSKAIKKLAVKLVDSQELANFIDSICPLMEGVRAEIGSIWDKDE